MTTDWAPAHLPLDMEGRRIFDTALGILIGFRRCSSDAAFHELLGAAQRHGFPAFPMAWALVHLAGGAQNPLKHSAPRNRLHGANGVSSSRHLSRRRVDGRCGFGDALELTNFRPQRPLTKRCHLTRGRWQWSSA